LRALRGIAVTDEKNFFGFKEKGSNEENRKEKNNKFGHVKGGLKF
jgi:hypothetical protein